MGGFDAKNKNAINELYLCAMCSLILKEPFQLECSDRLCESCIEAVEESTFNCPKCQQATSKAEVTRDRGCKNDMRSIEIHCSLCEWTGLFRGYEEHFNEKHPNLTCEFCNEVFDLMDELREHKQNKNCSKYYPIGPFTADDSSNSSPKNSSLQDYSNTIYSSTPPTAPVPIRERQTSNRNNERSAEIRINMGDAEPYLVSVLPNRNSTARIQEIYALMNNMNNLAQTMTDNVERLRHYQNRLRVLIESFITDFSSIRSRHQEQNARMRAIQRDQEAAQQTLATLRQTVEEIQTESCDGALVWKITDVAENITNNQLEQEISRYSPVFYSLPGGYKMRARLYIDRNANNGERYVSFFFILMPGTNDAILDFPFNFNVAFCLYDQISSRQPIIKSFRPNILSRNSLQFRFENNIDSGIWKFVPLSILQQEGNPYVRDDTMFVHVMVNFGGIPNALFPYAFSLNPGLPKYTQQELIQEEAKRREQQ